MVFMIYERSIVLLTGSHIYMMVSQPEPSTVPPSVGLTRAHPNTNIKMYLEGLWKAFERPSVADRLTYLHDGVPAKQRQPYD